MKPSLTIALEANPLCRSQGTGMTRYVESLVWAWPRVASEDRVVLFHRNHRRLQRPIPPGCELRGYSDRGPAKLLRDLTLRDADVVHHTRNRIALATSKPHVVTLHDVFHLSPVAATVGGVAEASPEAELRQIAGQGAWVITVSRHARSEILAALGLDPERVIVVPQGVDGQFHPAESAAVRDVQQAHRIAGDYILFTGALTERKNLPRVLGVFGEIDRRTGGRYRLVLAGSGWEAWERRIPAAVRPRVVFAGYVPDAHLPPLYTGASLFLWPSLHEGFGLPLLEAMACGCPVVTSRATACEEVVGDAGILVDPTDVQDMAEATAGVLGNASLAANLRERGLARARDFTWEATARGTREVYGAAITAAVRAGPSGRA